MTKSVYDIAYTFKSW